MILVAGSTGFLGSEVCRRLTAAGQPVRALVRPSSNPEKVTYLKTLGAQIVEGDVRDRASLAAACGGASAVISTISSMPSCYTPGENDIAHVDVQGVQGLMDAARSAGVEHFVYTSFSGNMDLDFPLRNAKRAAEEHLRRSGLTYTILRPSYFMEVWLSPMLGMDYVEGKAQIYGEGANPISFISLGDVAQFATASLGNEAARNATLELGGPQALGPLQVVKEFEAVVGRPFAVEHVPVEGIQAQADAATDPMERSFAGLMLCYAQGDAIDMGDLLSDFPLALTTVADYAQTVAVVAAA